MAAGLGFKDFTTGEVLTAADVDGYLMQGIWVFDDATARDAAVTAPQEGNACYLKDTNEVLTYSGSVWVAVGGAAIGLTLVSTTPFTSVASQTVTDCFSSSFNHYRIVISLRSSAGGVVSARFGVSGTPTTTNYYWGGISRSTANTTVTGTNGSNVSSIQLSNDISGTASSICVIDVASPNEALRTSFISQSQSISQLYNLASGYQDSASQFTDFVMLPATGNISGKVSVYGYNQ